MTTELKDFLSFYLPNQNLQPFLERFHELKIKRGKHLLKPKQDCNYIAFIQKGAFGFTIMTSTTKRSLHGFRLPNVITDLPVNKQNVTGKR